MCSFSAGVNARVSDAFDWIQANVCAMSDFPPADLCLYVPAETKIWKVLAAAFGVTVLVLVASRCYGRSSQNRKYSLDRSDSSLDELEDLKTKNPKLSKFDSYESVGVELP